MANDFINTERELRRITNNSQPVINVENNSPRDIPEGDLRFTHLGKNLVLNKKHKGLLWKSNFSADGNQYVEKTLTAEELKFTKRFTTYKIIAHNMTDNIGTAEVFLPWFGITEDADLGGASSSFLVPYSMTLKKIMFRPEAISTGSYDLVVRLKKMDDGDTTVDTVATATYEDSLAAATFISVEKSIFDNNPKFEIGDNCGVSIQSASGDYGGGSTEWKITSVWEVEIII